METPKPTEAPGEGWGICEARLDAGPCTPAAKWKGCRAAWASPRSPGDGCRDSSRGVSKVPAHSTASMTASLSGADTWAQSCFWLQIGSFRHFLSPGQKPGAGGWENLCRAWISSGDGESSQVVTRSWRQHSHSEGTVVCNIPCLCHNWHDLKRIDPL